MLNLGVGGLINRIEIQADYFTETRTNILMDRAQIPSTMGLQAPTEQMLKHPQMDSKSHWTTVKTANDLFIGREQIFLLLIVNMSSMKSWIIPVLDYLGDQELD